MKGLYKTKTSKTGVRLRGRIIDNSGGEIIIQNVAGLHRISTSDNPRFPIGSIVEVSLNDEIIPLVIPEPEKLKCPSRLSIELMELKMETMRLIRESFDGNGFIELETPILTYSPGIETHLDGFETVWMDFFNKKKSVYLPTSPEFSLKKALVAGLEKIYEIARVFRNGSEIGTHHHPEFNMLEWYRAYSDYTDIMSDTENLIFFLYNNLRSKYTFRKINFSPPYERISVKTAFEKYCGIDLEKAIYDNEYFNKEFNSLQNLSSFREKRFDEIFFETMAEYIEPKLGKEKPVFIYDYPAEFASLSAIKEDNPAFCERVEMYIDGIEIANGFTELNDPVEYRRRFENIRRHKKEIGRPIPPIDKEFIGLIECGMPPAGGIALGIERLLLGMCKIENISSFFPFSPFK